MKTAATESKRDMRWNAIKCGQRIALQWIKYRLMFQFNSKGFLSNSLSLLSIYLLLVLPPLFVPPPPLCPFPSLAVAALFDRIIQFDHCENEYMLSVLDSEKDNLLNLKKN